MNHSHAPAIIDELYTSLCSLLPGGISNPRPGLTPGTALRAVGSGNVRSNRQSHFLFVKEYRRMQ